MRNGLIILPFLLLSINSTIAQSNKFLSDTVKLESFNITASRTDLPASFVSMRFDSTQKATYDNQSLSDLLSDNSGLYLKEYGVSGLSSISFRGTGANHSKIFWNGISLNSPSLGQVDTRLIPIAMSNNIEVHPGSGSLMEGAGGFGGNLIINNELSDHSNDGIDLLLTAGSFDSYAQRLRANFSEGKFSFVTYLYRTQSENDFEYVDYHLDDQAASVNRTRRCCSLHPTSVRKPLQQDCQRHLGIRSRRLR